MTALREGSWGTDDRVGPWRWAAVTNGARAAVAITGLTEVSKVAGDRGSDVEALLASGADGAVRLAWKRVVSHGALNRGGIRSWAHVANRADFASRIVGRAVGT